MKIVKVSLLLLVIFVSSFCLQAMEQSRNVLIIDARLVSQLSHAIHNHNAATDDMDDVDSQARTPLTTPRNINYEDEDGCTNLYYAVHYECEREVKFLLGQHASLNCSALQGRNLEEVTRNKKIKYLIKNAREDRNMVLDLFADSLQQK